MQNRFRCRRESRNRFSTTLTSNSCFNVHGEGPTTPVPPECAQLTPPGHRRSHHGPLLRESLCCTISKNRGERLRHSGLRSEALFDEPWQKRDVIAA